MGLGNYRYTIRRTLKEDNSYDYNDGTHTVFLSTKGTNDDQVSDSLVKVFKYEKGTRCQVQLCDVFVSEHFFAFLSAALFGSSRLVLIDQEDIFCGK